MRAVLVILTACLFVLPAQAQYSGGSGTAGDPYQIAAAEMQTASTFLDAGWDFVNETENGTDDIWWIDEGQDYPRLWWEQSEDVGADLRE